jgi:hypothetical protein
MMMRPNPCQETTFGYLSALESAENGFFGGYLVISPLGLPLEFHCTAPVRPSRAQQILYGPSLQPYLLGEQIGGTLLAQAELTPKVILTDQPAVLFLRSQSDVPLVQMLTGPTDLAARSLIDPHAAGSSAVDGKPDSRFSRLGYEWELPAGFESDRDAVAALLTELARHVDVGEPFGRIHEAIREALRIGAPGPDAHGQAA